MSEFDAPVGTGSGFAPSPSHPISRPFADTGNRHIAPVALASRKVTSEYAELTRVLQPCLSVRVSALEDDAVLTLRLADDMHAGWGSPIVLEGSFGTIELAKGSRLLRALTGIDLAEEVEADEDRWEWFQAAVIARLAETPLKYVTRLMRASVAEASDQVAVQFGLRTARHAFVTYARARTAAWLAFLRQTAWRKDSPPTPEWSEVPFEADVILARHTLPASELGTIRTGDIFLPDRSRFACNGEGWVALGALKARVRYASPGLLEMIAMEGKLDTDAPYDEDENDFHAGDATDGSHSSSISDAADGTDGTDADGADNIPLTVDFLLGTVRMSLGDVRTLGEGSILPLDGEPAAVRIRSGGRVLGIGEVVDVDGRLGVRVVRWGPAG